MILLQFDYNKFPEIVDNNVDTSTPTHIENVQNNLIK